MIELLGQRGAETALVLCIAPVALLASWHDLREFRIPNSLSLAGLVIFALTCVIFLPLSEIPSRLIGAGFVFLVCFVMFAAGAMGGGDAKLLPVVALFIPGYDAMAVLMALAVSGLACVAFMGAVSLGRRLSIGVPPRFLGEVADWQVWSGGKHVPYALAISVALTLYVVARLAV